MRPSPEAVPTEEAFATTRPAIPAGVEEYFLPVNVRPEEALKSMGRFPTETSSKSILYRPALVAQASVRFLDRKIDVDALKIVTGLDLAPDRRGIIRWDEAEVAAIPLDELSSHPMPEARFAELQSPLSDEKLMKKIGADFLDHVYRSHEMRLPSNPELKLAAGPEMTLEEFRRQCAEAADKMTEDEAEKLRKKYEKKIKRLQDKLTKEERELAEDKEEHSARRMEEMAVHAENLLGLFGSSRRRRRVSSSLTKRRMTSRAKSEVEESQEAIEALQQELDELEEEMQDALEELDDHWDEIAEGIEELVLTPKKKDIHQELFGVAWVPFWQLEVAGDRVVTPAYPL